MLTLHLLGHAHVSRNHQPVPVSAKAVALITYLTIEKLPQHRERLADLLWTTAEARKNLRVELARIRTAGLNLFPASRQLLYLENVTSDFDLWQSRLGQDMNQAQLAEWLTMLRGFPLSGLEDLGSSSFQEWVDQQRWTLSGQIEDGLSQMYWQYARGNHTWATRLIAARADALGYELADEPAPAPGTLPLPVPDVALPPAPVDSSGPLHFERGAQEQALQRLLQAAGGQAQVVVMHGPPGIGKSYLADRLAAQHAGLTLRVPSLRSGRLVLASLAQTLIGVCDPDCADALRRMLLSPTTLEEDLVKVAVALGKLSQPVLLVFDQAHAAPTELAPLLTYLLEVPAEGPRLFLLLSRQRPAQAPLTRALRGRTGGVYSELEVPPLSQSSVQQALEACLPPPGNDGRPRGRHSDAARLLQRSEGNPLHLLSLLDTAEDPAHSGGAHFPQSVRDIYSADIDQWPPTLMEAMVRLSAIYGPFDQRVARAALGEPLSGSADGLLYTALDHQILHEVEPGGALRLPDLTFLPDPDRAETLYAFASEGLRIALASRAPQLVRQEVRRSLVPVLAQGSPGLAAHYARRSGLTGEAERLQLLYRTGLQARQLGGAAPDPARSAPGRSDSARSAAPEPRRVPASPLAPLACQGYLVAQSDHGWLDISSAGHYGHPQTLRLLLPLPAGAEAGAQAELRLVWQLDVFRGGEELGPDQVPFALRLGLAGSGTAHVLTRAATPDYLEEGVRHSVHADVTTGQWMEHRLLFPTGAEGGEPRTLELSVRALDVALTLGALSWQGQHLLPLTASAPSLARGAGPRSTLIPVAPATTLPPAPVPAAPGMGEALIGQPG